tara:strand:- start:326 stop:1423 length:1098 start_codon:yes stop_codon:yes gene_type:complete
MNINLITARSVFTFLSAALLLAVSSTAQCHEAANSKACCKSTPAAKAKSEVVAPATTKKVAGKGVVSVGKVVPLFNDVCPITGAPTNAASPTMTHAGYEVSVCHPSCIAQFAGLDKAKQVAFVARFTGEHRRAAFPVRKPGEVEKSCCGSCDPSAKPAADCGTAGCGEDASKGTPAEKRSSEAPDEACGGCEGDAKAEAKGKQAGKGKGPGKGNGLGKGKGAMAKGSCQDTSIDVGRTTATAPAAYLKRLQSILAEELFARDYYQAASKSLGGRRFGNLSRAEQRHADAIASAIRSLGGKPVLSHGRSIVPAKTMAESERVCRDIEKLVIKEYKGLIQDCPDPALLKVLNNIQSANLRHLRAVGG